MRAVVWIGLLAGCGGGMAAPPTIDVTQPDGGDAGAGADADAGGATDAAAEVAPPADAGSCNGSASSTLDGVALAFPTARCRYSQSEVAAGIQIPYEVLVSKAVSGVHPAPNDEGDCEKPGPSGVIVGFTISGVGQSYCLCDLGLCTVTTFSTSPAAGRYPGTIDWDGTNWRGPSDVPSPKGPPFPPDTYEVAIFARGSRDDGAGGETPFEIRATRTIAITPDP
jgi:hypothetical protein